MVTFISIHGMDVYTLLDSRVAPNIISPQLVRCLPLKEEVTRVVLMGNSEKLCVFGIVTTVPVFFEPLEA